MSPQHNATDPAAEGDSGKPFIAYGVIDPRGFSNKRSDQTLVLAWCGHRWNQHGAVKNETSVGWRYPHCIVCSRSLERSYKIDAVVSSSLYARAHVAWRARSNRLHLEAQHDPALWPKLSAGKRYSDWQKRQVNLAAAIISAGDLLAAEPTDEEKRAGMILDGLLPDASGNRGVR